MTKIAFVYPGQGSQEEGMASKFYEESNIFRKVLDYLDKICDFELRQLCLDASSEKLRKTRNTQPAVLATGVAAQAAVANATSVTPDLTTGHSLGQYTALASIGGISLSDCISLIRKRGELMGTVQSEEEGVMYAVLFANSSTVSKACADIERASVAGLNTQNQTVISGSRSAIQAVQREITNQTTAKFIKLDTEEAFHSPLMENAAIEFSNILNHDVFSDDLRAPIVSDIDGEIYKETQPLVDILSRQITKTINWREVMNTIDNNEIEVVIEFPPAGTLSGFFNKSLPEKDIISIESPEDIDAIRNL